MIETPNGRFEITVAILSVERESARVASPGHGAIATFTGTVREHAGGKTGVTGIFYEAFAEMAEAKMSEVGAEAIAKFSGGKSMRIAITHRVGDLAVGDSSVVIAVGAERRKEALDACEYAINRLKEIVPIWKKEKFGDGSTWVGWGGDAPSDASSGISPRKKTQDDARGFDRVVVAP